MADPSFGQIFMQEAQDILQKEADAFASIIDTMAGYTVDGEVLNTFQGAGAALLTLFFCMEAFTYCAQIDFNGGIEGAIRIGMKLVVSALIIQNVPNVVRAVAGILKCDVDFSDAVSGIGEQFGSAMVSGSGFEEGPLGIYCILLGLIYVIIIILMFVLFVMITLTIFGVVFETAVLEAISPVALSTLVNSQARSTGISFIKNFAAVSMQWGVLTVCFAAYKTIGTDLVSNFDAAITSGLSDSGIMIYIMKMASPMICLVMLAITVSKASDITKRALGG